MRGELDQFPNLTGTDRSMLVNNVGAAIHTSQHLGDQADQIAAAARTAFVDSMHSSLWIAAGLAFCAAVVAFTQLPRQTVHATHHAHGASGRPRRSPRRRPCRSPPARRGRRVHRTG